MKRIALLASLLMVSFAPAVGAQTLEQRVTELETITSATLNPPSSSFVLDEPLWTSITDLQSDFAILASELAGLGNPIEANTAAIEENTGAIEVLSGQVADLSNRVAALEAAEEEPAQSSGPSLGFRGFGFGFNGGF